MPRKKNITKSEAKSVILENFSQKDFLNLLNQYAKQHKDVSKEVTQYEMASLEKVLTQHNINEYCPHCGSHIIVKNGKYKNGLQCFKCTRLTNINVNIRIYINEHKKCTVNTI